MNTPDRTAGPLCTDGCSVGGEGTEKKEASRWTIVICLAASDCQGVEKELDGEWMRHFDILHFKSVLMGKRYQYVYKIRRRGAMFYSWGRGRVLVRLDSWCRIFSALNGLHQPWPKAGWTVVERIYLLSISSSFFLHCFFPEHPRIVAQYGSAWSPVRTARVRRYQRGVRRCRLPATASNARF